MNSHRNYGLWMIMVCQYKFIGGKKRTTVVWVIDSGGEGVWELCTFCSILL